jgi:CRP/FNR family cyclic AMP-dependent transcriptional regulator
VFDGQERATMKVQGIFRNAQTVREVAAGDVIFEEGSGGEEMFGVIEGEVELRLPDGHTFKIAQDDTFGEMAVIDSSPRSATAVALADTKLAVIDKSTFLFLVHETPLFALQVMKTLTERLRSRA